MESERKIFAHPETHDFFRDALADPNNPVGEEAKRSPRDVGIVMSYLASPGTLEEIGRIYGLTRERVRQIVGETIKNIRDYSSAELQEEYPEGEILVRKPTVLETSLHRSKLGKLARRVKLLHQKGLTGQELVEQLDVPPTQLNRLRSQKGHFGIEHIGLPSPSKHSLPSENRRLEKRLKEVRDPEEEAELLTQVSESLYSKLRGGKGPVLIPIKKVIPQGFKRSGRIVGDYVSVLRDLGIPVGEVRIRRKPGEYPQRYYFILRRRMEEAQEVISKNLKLQSLRK